MPIRLPFSVGLGLRPADRPLRRAPADPLPIWDPQSWLRTRRRLEITLCLSHGRLDRPERAECILNLHLISRAKHFLDATCERHPETLPVLRALAAGPTREPVTVPA